MVKLKNAVYLLFAWIVIIGLIKGCAALREGPTDRESYCAGYAQATVSERPLGPVEANDNKRQIAFDYCLKAVRD